MIIAILPIKQTFFTNLPANPEHKLDATTAARPNKGFWVCDKGLIVGMDSSGLCATGPSTGCN